LVSVFEIFYRFLILGFISFGGPIAHLGYFKKTFVDKLKWLDDVRYSKMIALSQFLPGPSSSQVGFSIGLYKGGLFGAISAFIAFTLPSFIALYLLVKYGISSTDNALIVKVIASLKLFAVVIVVDAIFSMYKSFCNSKFTIGIFIVSTIFLIVFNSIFSQIIVLVFSAVLGILFIDNKTDTKDQKSKKTKKIPLVLFFLLLFVLPIISFYSKELEVFKAFYEAGSLVFGGGHVVLPLLENSIGDMVSKDSFILGYSLAQAVPGPMFTIASYLGADIFISSPLKGALIATIAIFLPGFLLILAFYDSFESYTKKANIINAVTAVNAAVVGLLSAVLFSTIIPSAIVSLFDSLIVLIGIFIIRKFKIPILYMILFFIIIGFIR